jgi:hypothetical protein
VFDRAVRHALDRQGWEIVRVNRRMMQSENQTAAQLRGQKLG